MAPFSVVFSIGLLFYSFDIYPQKPTNHQYAWQSQNIAPYKSPMSHFSVSTFVYPKVSSHTPGFAVYCEPPDIEVAFKKLILSDDSAFLAYSWVGGNWTLYFGFQIDV